MFAKIPLASLDVSDLTDKAEVSSELAGEDLIRAARDMLPGQQRHQGPRRLRRRSLTTSRS